MAQMPRKFSSRVLWVVALSGVTVALLRCGSSAADPGPATPAGFTIDASAGANGRVEPAGAVPVSAGAEVRFRFLPDPGFVVETVLADGIAQAAIPRYAFVDVRANHTLTVSFRPVAPLTPRALDFLNRVGGTSTLAGQHNKEPNSAPTAATERVSRITGRRPALWSGDFLFPAGSVEPDNRWTMIYEAKHQWDQGALISLMWHACPPSQPEPCAWEGGVKSALTDAQWTDLVTDGGALNAAWHERLDTIVPYLQYLQDNGVEVLWRPFHEMNQGAFWWGGRPGPQGTARLFQLTRDYLVDVKGLRNLIWVWDVQDFWSDAGSTAAIVKDVEAYDPGGRYWEIVALDPYGTGYAQQNYDALRAIAGDKPMAIGECEFVPSAALLAQQPRWTFFMLWPDFIDANAANLPAVYAAPNVLTLDEMPGW
jgi:mannan endo-1,4-beta-mannosidase